MLLLTVMTDSQTPREPSFYFVGATQTEIRALWPSACCAGESRPAATEIEYETIGENSHDL